MSLYYNINEQFSVTDTTESSISEAIEVMKRQFSLVGALMLTDDAEILSLDLTADGIKYSFVGKEITPELHIIFRTIDQARSIQLVTNYWYKWTVCTDHLNVGPFAFCEYIEELTKANPNILNNFFYSMYNEVESEPGDGKRISYGTKNRTLYNGEVQTVSDL